jgi:uncharacterized membrane protein
MAMIEKCIEVDAPVSTVYNQWTQFEDFPKFMEGVANVTQIDEKRLHWVAKVAEKQKSGTRRSPSRYRTSESPGRARAARRTPAT